MRKIVILGSLTITLLCFGCEPTDTPTGSAPTISPNVKAFLGGESDIRANFQDGLSTLGWPQYDDATAARVSTDGEYLIDVDDDPVVSSAVNLMIFVRETADEDRSIVPRQKDGSLRLGIGSNQLRIQWHSHDLWSCINRRNVWHVNLAIEKKDTPKQDMGIVNIHIAAWKDGSQKCLGMLVTGTIGQELFCRVQCLNKPGQQEIRDMLTGALVTAGVASSLVAGWLANTAAPALKPVLMAL